MPRLALALCLAWLALPAAKAADPLAEKLDAFFDGPNYKQARWGALFVDAKTGEVVYARDPDKLFLPASVTKLYTCAAAWTAFGPDHAFVTPVYRRGEVKDGVLAGDLILVASGDLSFGGRASADGKTLAFTNSDHTYADGGSETRLTEGDPLAALKSLARQVKAAGIERVEGEILVDDRLFAPARSSGSGPGVVSPILVNDNVIDVTVKPGAKAGDPATVTFRPETHYLSADLDVRTGNRGTKVRLEVPHDDPRNTVVRGSVPVGHAPVVGILAIDKPAEFARTLFIEALKAEGVRVAAPLVGGHGTLPAEKPGYDAADRVASHASPPLSEAIKVTLKVSHNLYASTLPCLLAARKGQRTLREGLRLERAALADLGVDTKTISFAGGAGGANADHVTPRATVQLLQAMRKRPDWPAFEACLPVLGVDGTLAAIGTPGHPAKGHVKAKTGTMYWTDTFNDRTLLTSKALGGVMTTAAGRELVFALFVNGVPLPPGTPTKREGLALGRVCELVYDGVE